MGVEAAVVAAECQQVLPKQREVQRLFARDAQPVDVERDGHAGEAPDRVEREVDRVELDVRHRMQQRGAAFERERRTGRHVLGWHEARQRGAAGQCLLCFERGVGIDIAGVEVSEQLTRPSGFGHRVGQAKNLQSALAWVHP